MHILVTMANGNFFYVTQLYASIWNVRKKYNKMCVIYENPVLINFLVFIFLEKYVFSTKKSDARVILFTTNKRLWRIPFWNSTDVCDGRIAENISKLCYKVHIIAKIDFGKLKCAFKYCLTFSGTKHFFAIMLKWSPEFTNKFNCKLLLRSEFVD